MFVRAKRRFKDGKEHVYWSVVENCRNRDGRVVRRQVLHLGEINDSQRAAWCRSIEVLGGDLGAASMALFADDREAPELDCEVVRVRVRVLSLHRPRQWGACWLALTLWERLTSATHALPLRERRLTAFQGWGTCARREAFSQLRGQVLDVSSSLLPVISFVTSATSCAHFRSKPISDAVSIRGAGEIPSLRLSKAIEGVAELPPPPVFKGFSMFRPKLMELPFRRCQLG